MRERVFDFSIDPLCAANPPDVRELMAMRLADCDDISIEARYARSADLQVGGDDQAAGCAYTYLLAVSTDPREVIECELMAADLLRTARRTMH
jgi:hypothetical protein